MQIEERCWECVGGRPENTFWGGQFLTVGWGRCPHIAGYPGPRACGGLPAFSTCLNPTFPQKTGLNPPPPGRLPGPAQSDLPFLITQSTICAACIMLGFLLSVKQTAHVYMDFCVCISTLTSGPLLQLDSRLLWSRNFVFPLIHPPFLKTISWLIGVLTSWVHHTSSFDGH